jgi:SAM-dependent MidA family methyltransferase
MGHARIIARVLANAWDGDGPTRIVELGAGDGRFALSLARGLASRWPRVEFVLVDRQEIVHEATRRDFRELGWNCKPAQSDVFDWLTRTERRTGDCIVANLFLHHFSDEQLRRLLSFAAERAVCFAACEPRRSRPVLAASRSLGLIGCNAVTRHDAVVSVRAGFRGKELSDLWTADGSWSLAESEAGLFSHIFVASSRIQTERQA